MPQAELLSLNPANIARAAALLHAGRLVAFPTETVYGLGADACNGDAVAGIFAAKARPSFNPLISHVASTEQAAQLVQWDERAQALAEAFWPGPLTLVLPLAQHSPLSALTTAGLPSAAVRVPAHEAAQALLRAFGGPVAAPSANPSGQISPTHAHHVQEGLGHRIDALLSAGPAQEGLESTIVSLLDTPTLLRPGTITRAELGQVLGVAPEVSGAHSGVIAPGQLLSHYAPGAGMRLNAHAKAGAHEVLLGFGPDIAGDLNLSQSASLREAAANLFDHLHRLDALCRANPALTTIAVAPIPPNGLGRAINDRLTRAAAPKP